MNKNLTDKRMAEYIIIPKYIEDRAIDCSTKEVENNIVDWMDDIMNRYVSDNVRNRLDVL
ncbi:hypothetical protein [Paenibacillus taichungensis]|uniref:hypothetical protein n=1 Tax=Paenibacillus taichungensis TaxID=484184 RepID=UPI0039A1DACA